MRVTRGLSALLLAVLLCLLPSVAHADGDPAAETTDTPSATPPTPATDAPTEPDPTEPTPTEDTPTEDTPSEDAPSTDTPSEDAPSDGSTSDDGTSSPAKGLAARLSVAAAALARPVANNDVFSVKTNTGNFPTNLGLVRIGANGVFKNDVPTAGGDQTPNIISLVDSVDHGTLNLHGDGGFTYIPTVGYAGTDEFRYRYQTDDGESDDAYVTITVGSGAPIATDDDYLTAPDTQLVVGPPGVFANDSDVALFGFSVVDGVEHGTLTQPGLFKAGRFIYTPSAGFTGIDTFTYRYSTLLGGPSNTATVTIIVGEPGVAVDDFYSVRAEETLTVPALTGVSANDSITNGTVELVSADPFGTLNLQADGSFTYQPDNGYVGPVEFEYRFTDPVTTLQSNVATVSITITPNAVDDSYTTASGQTLTVDPVGIYANDTPFNGGDLTIVDDVDDGTLTPNGDTGGFTYEPDAGFVGVDVFTYAFEVFNGVSDIATVSITVTPVAVDDELTVPDCEDTSFYTLGNDLNTDPLVSVPTIVEPTDHGQLSAADGLDVGSLIYAPEAGFVGDDTFTYTYEVNGLVSNTATVTLHVAACDDGGGTGDGDQGSDDGADDDGDAALPDTGSPLAPWLLALAGLSVVSGLVLVRRRNGGAEA